MEMSFKASAPPLQTWKPHLVWSHTRTLRPSLSPHPSAPGVHGDLHSPRRAREPTASHLVGPAALLPQVEGYAVRLLLGAEQVDVKSDEELPGPRGCGPPAGDEGAGAKVGRPLCQLELWGHSPWRSVPHGGDALLGWGERGGHPPLQGPPDPPLGGGDTAPSQAGPRTPRLGWPAGSGGWPSALPHHRGTLQGEPGSSAPGGRDPEPHSQRRTQQGTWDRPPSAPLLWERPFSVPRRIGVGGHCWTLRPGQDPSSAHPGAGQAPALPLPMHRCPEKAIAPTTRVRMDMGACTGRTLPFFLTCISIVQ